MLTIELGDVYPELKSLRLRGRLVGNKVLPYWNRAQFGERAEQAQAPTARDDDAQSGGFGQKISDMLFGSGRKQGVVQSVAKQTTRNVGGSIGRSVGSAIGESVLGKTGKKFGGQIGNQIVRGILGSIFGGRR